MKTLESIKSKTRLEKGRVGVSGDGSNNCSHNADGYCSDDSNEKFIYVRSSYIMLTFRYLLDIPKLICFSMPSTLIFKTSSSTNSSTSATQIVIKYDKLNDDGSYDSDFNKKFYSKLQYNSCITHLNDQDKLTNRFINYHDVGCGQV